MQLGRAGYGTQKPDGRSSLSFPLPCVGNSCSLTTGNFYFNNLQIPQLFMTYGPFHDPIQYVASVYNSQSVPPRDSPRRVSRSAPRRMAQVFRHSLVFNSSLLCITLKIGCDSLILGMEIYLFLMHMIY